MFVRSQDRRSSTDAVVHAVGQRVYVNRSGGAVAHVDLMNEEGTAPIARLADGAEVMIVAWKPRGATGTRYCVRCTADGVEGWLQAGNLRRARTATVTAAPAAPPAKPARAPSPVDTRNAKPRFGGR